jgi:hypothetical protein
MRLLETSLVVLTLAAPSTYASTAATEHPDLSGHWRLNADQSEDAREKLREAGRERFGGGGRGGGGMGGGFGGGMRGGGMGRGGGGGRGGGMGRRPEGDDADGNRVGRLTDLLPRDELTISQDPSEIHVLEQGGRDWHLLPDGKKHKDSVGATETKAEWSERELIIDAKLGDRKVHRAVGLSENGKQLLVLVRLETPMAKVKVLRVYDRVSGETAAPSATTAPDPETAEPKGEPEAR